MIKHICCHHRYLGLLCNEYRGLRLRYLWRMTLLYHTSTNSITSWCVVWHHLSMHYFLAIWLIHQRFSIRNRVRKLINTHHSNSAIRPVRTAIKCVWRCSIAWLIIWRWYYHPRYWQWLVGTWELKWHNRHGGPTDPGDDALVCLLLRATGSPHVSPWGILAKICGKVWTTRASIPLPHAC